MDIEEYSDIVMDHFMCPRNMGVINNSIQVVKGTIADDCAYI